MSISVYRAGAKSAYGKNCHLVALYVVGLRSYSSYIAKIKDVCGRNGYRNMDFAPALYMMQRKPSSHTLYDKPPKEIHVPQQQHTHLQTRGIKCVLNKITALLLDPALLPAAESIRIRFTDVIIKFIYNVSVPSTVLMTFYYWYRVFVVHREPIQVFANHILVQPGGDPYRV